MDYIQSHHNKNNKAKNWNTQRKLILKVKETFKPHMEDHYICKYQSRNNSK